MSEPRAYITHESLPCPAEVTGVSADRQTVGVMYSDRPRSTVFTFLPMAECVVWTRGELS